VVFTAMIAIISVILTFYSVTILQISYNTAKQDNTLADLSPLFIKCSDEESQYPSDQYSDNFRKTVYYNCITVQSPFAFIIAWTGIVYVFTFIASLVHLYKSDIGLATFFPVLNAISFTLATVVIVAVGSIAVTVSSKYYDCSGYSTTDITSLTNAGLTCYYGEGIKLDSIVNFMVAYTSLVVGSALALVTVIMLLLLKNCCLSVPAGGAKNTQTN